MMGKDMDQPRRLLSELTSLELSRRAIEYRRMAITANGQATRFDLDKLAIRYALLAAKREVEEASNGEAVHQDQSEVDKLICLAEQAAADHHDPIRLLADIIQTIGDREADPYLLIGVLVEGAVHTLATQIPGERQEDTAKAALHLLVERLRAGGMLDNR
jgi:hypothetical protein